MFINPYKLGIYQVSNAFKIFDSESKQMKFANMPFICIIDSHYSWILYLRVCLLTKIYFNPSQHLWVLQDHLQTCRTVKM